MAAKDLVEYVAKSLVDDPDAVTVTEVESRFGVSPMTARRDLAELERQGVQPIGLSTHQATLDDVFLHLTGRALKNGEGAQVAASAA